MNYFKSAFTKVTEAISSQVNSVTENLTQIHNDHNALISQEEAKQKLKESAYFPWENLTTDKETEEFLQQKILAINSNEDFFITACPDKDLLDFDLENFQFIAEK